VPVLGNKRIHEHECQEYRTPLSFPSVHTIFSIDILSSNICQNTIIIYC
jgi:hypothetical protein